MTVRVFLYLLLMLSGSVVLTAQNDDLVGPMLASTWDTELVFYDLGTESGYISDLQVRTGDVLWSPDGCRVLVERIGGGWLVVSTASNGYDLALPDGAQAPEWRPDGKKIAYNVFADAQWTIHLFDTTTGVVDTIPDRGIALDWLSTQELFTISDGQLSVLNTNTLSSRRFGPATYPMYPAGLGWLAPDYISLAVYDTPAYFLVGGGSGEPIPFERVIPGLEIRNLNTTARWQVDLSGEFVAGVNWSPSSARLVAVTTATPQEKEVFTIWIIEPDGERMIELGQFNLGYYPQFAGYVPTWSPEEDALAIQTKDGPIVYRLADGTMQTLDSKLRGPLYWSPTSDYTAVDSC